MATDLLERELEGVRIETAPQRGEAGEDWVCSDLGGLLVIPGHIETHRRQAMVVARLVNDSTLSDEILTVAASAFGGHRDTNQKRNAK